MVFDNNMLQNKLGLLPRMPYEKTWATTLAQINGMARQAVEPMTKKESCKLGCLYGASVEMRFPVVTEMQSGPAGNDDGSGDTGSSGASAGDSGSSGNTGPTGDDDQSGNSGSSGASGHWG